MNEVKLKEDFAREKNSEIELISPKNEEEIELTNSVILKYINGYKRGLSSELFCEGENYEPNGLKLEWKSSKVGLWVVYLDYNPDFITPITYTTNEKFIEINEHFTAQKVYWKVALSDGTASSQVYCFNLKRLPETISLEGVVNVRDIGGYEGLDGKRVKRGIIYRGAYVDDVTEKGKKIARDSLKIRVDLDLRNEGEGSANDISSPLGEDVKHILRCGCMYTGNEWSGVEHVGKEGIDIPEGARKLVEELRVFACADNFPLYTHCVLGRDRTGTLIAVLLALCGVSKRDIMLDYELSFFTKSGTAKKEDVLRITGYFEKVIEHIENFEGNSLSKKTESFLKSSGMTVEEIISIRNNVLEERI